MAADSIAKLSVLITGDTSPLNAALSKGTAHVRQFDLNVSRGRSSIDAIGRSVNMSSVAMNAMKGNVMGLSQTLLGGGGLAVGAALAAAALVRMGNAGAEAAQKIALANQQVERQTQSLLAMRGQHSTVIPNALEFHTAELERENARTFSAANRLKASIAEVRAAAQRDFSDTFTNNPKIGQEPTQFSRGNRRLNITELRRWNEEQIAMAKTLAAEEKKIHEQRERAMQSLRSKAESVSDSLRTPAEIFADTVSELNTIFQHGLMSVESLKRGTSAAKKDLMDAAAAAAKAAQKTRESAYSPVGAYDRNTTAAFSAVQSARAESKQQLEVAKQQLAVEKAQLKAQEEGNKLLKEKKPVVFQRGSF